MKTKKITERRSKVRNTSSIKHFTVREGKRDRNMFSSVTMILALILLIELIWRRTFFSAPFAAAFLICWIRMVIWKLSVRENEILSISRAGIRRRAKFSDISGVSKTSSGRLLVYVNGRHFASLSRGSYGLTNFMRRCEKESIQIDHVAEQNSPVTIFSLYIRAESPIFPIIGFVFVIGVLVEIYCEREYGDDFFNGMMFILIVSIAPLVTCSFMPMQGIARIMEQQRVLGFKFNEEMTKEDVRVLPFVNDEWFIALEGATRIIVFRRDWIEGMSSLAVKEIMLPFFLQWYSQSAKYYVKILTANSSTCMVYSTNRKTIEQLCEWWQAV